MSHWQQDRQIPIALSTWQQPSRARAGTQMLLTLTTTPRFQLCLWEPERSLWVRAMGSHLSQREQGEGTEQGMPSHSPIYWQWQRWGMSSILPSVVRVAAQRKSLLPKRDECEAQRKLISLSGSADGTASWAKGKGDPLCGCKLFPFKHHQDHLFIWQTSNNSLSAARCECRRLLTLAPTGRWPPSPLYSPWAVAGRDWWAVSWSFSEKKGDSEE